MLHQNLGTADIFQGGHEQFKVDVIELGQDAPFEFPASVVIQNLWYIVPFERHVVVLGKDRIDLGKRVVQGQQDGSDFILAGLIDVTFDQFGQVGIGDTRYFADLIQLQATRFDDAGQGVCKFSHARAVFPSQAIGPTIMEVNQSGRIPEPGIDYSVQHIRAWLNIFFNFV